MTAITFDTLKYANRLKAANVPAQQAEAEAEALSEVLEVNMQELVTKEDLRREIGDLRKDMQALESGLRKDMQAMELRLTFKLGSIVVVALGAFTALSKWIA